LSIMSHRTSLAEYYADLVDEHLGSIIEEVVDKYYSDFIDIELEYMDILIFITLELLNGVEEEDEKHFRQILKTLSRKRGIGKLVISYLVSRYIESRESSLPLYGDNDVG